MAIKNPEALIVRGNLQNVSEMYRNEQEDYVADRVFPIIDGLSRKTKVPKYVKGPWYRDEAQPRGRGAAASLVEYNFGSQNLDPINYAAAAKIPWEDYEDQRDPNQGFYDVEADALELIASKLDLKKEIRTASVIHTTDWAGAGAGGVDADGLWGTGTAANDTFIADFRTARNTIRNKTGKVINKLLIDYPTWDALEFSPALIALFQTTKFGADTKISIQALMAYLNLNEIIVSTSLKNTDEETVGDTGFTAANVMGFPAEPAKGMGFFFYHPGQAGRKVASAGYQYRLIKDNGSFRKSQTWVNNAEHSNYFDTEEELDIAAVGTDLGYLYNRTATA